MKVFSVYGYTNSGKTTTVINLIKELKKRGYEVATIKDIHAKSFSMEKEGSDSWKHRQASKNLVFARGQEATYQIWHKKLTLKEMLNHITADYVIVEGMKSFPLPKILCASSKADIGSLIYSTTFAISGKVSEKENKFRSFKIYNSIQDIKVLADLVEEKVFDILPYVDPNCCQACGMSCSDLCAEILAGNNSRKDCVMDNKEKIELIINDKKIEIVPFVQNLIYDVIIGIIKNLKGYKKGEIKIKINSKA